MWTPTSKAGTWVKYCTKPIRPCAEFDAQQPAAGPLQTGHGAGRPG